MTKFACGYQAEPEFDADDNYIGTRYFNLIPEWSEFDPPFGVTIDNYDRYAWHVVDVDVPSKTPPTALYWNSATNQLELKPDESERGYELSMISFYPLLIQYLTAVNPVLTELLKAITQSHPIRPSKELFNALKTALDDALAPKQ